MSTNHLINRNGVWYYRRRVPDAAVAAVGKRMVQFSLGTGLLKEAKKLRAVEDLKWATRFEVASGTSDSAITDSQVMRLVVDFVESTDKRNRERLLADAPASESERDAIKSDVEIERQILRNRDDPRGDELIARAEQKILAGRSGQIPAEFTELVRRALLELDARKLARLDDDHGRLFFDSVFNGREQPDVTFGEVADQYLAAVKEEAKANGTSAKWVDKQTANVALLKEIIGGNVPVRTADYDVCLTVRSKLAQLPSNRLKLYPKLSIDDAIKRAAKDGKPLMSHPTQSVYLNTLRGVLDLAAKKRLIATNPAAGMQPVVKETVAPKDKRRPFSLDQLQGFFGGKFYSECSTHAPAYKHDKTGWRFWLPLMCLLMGTRPNEVAQMNAADVKRTDAGTWYCDVVVEEGEDGKSLKTEYSRRRIPVHPTLIAIGFLDFVTGCGDGRLFPDLKPDAYGNFASYALKRFRDSFLPAEIKVEPRQTFYSFRHNFRDSLRHHVKAPPDVLQAIGGWSQGHLVSDDYGDKANPDYMVEFMKKIAYPGLDLSHLFIETGAKQ
jgi:integrase